MAEHGSCHLRLAVKAHAGLDVIDLTSQAQDDIAYADPAGTVMVSSPAAPSPLSHAEAGSTRASASADAFRAICRRFRRWRDQGIQHKLKIHGAPIFNSMTEFPLRRRKPARYCRIPQNS